MPHYAFYSAKHADRVQPATVPWTVVRLTTGELAAATFTAGPLDSPEDCNYTWDDAVCLGETDGRLFTFRHLATDDLETAAANTARRLPEETGSPLWHGNAAHRLLVVKLAVRLGLPDIVVVCDDNEVGRLNATVLLFSPGASLVEA